MKLFFLSTLLPRLSRATALAVIGAVVLMTGCSNMGVSGTALQRQKPVVRSVVLDLSDMQRAFLLRFRDGPNFFPAARKQAPEAFAPYGVQVDVITQVNEYAARAPTVNPSQAYRLIVQHTFHWSGSNGVQDGFRVDFFSPQGVLIWSGNTAVSGGLLRNFDETAQAFVNSLASELAKAGMLSPAGSDTAVPTTTSTTTATPSAPPRPLGSATLEEFRQFQQKRNPKAFAVNDKGRGFWVAGHIVTMQDARSATQLVLDNCEAAGAPGCRLIAVDDQVFLRQ